MLFKWVDCCTSISVRHFSKSNGLVCKLIKIILLIYSLIQRNKNFERKNHFQRNKNVKFMLLLHKIPKLQGNSIFNV